MNTGCVFIRATSCENLFMAYVNKKGADQPAHLHSLISAFVVCCLDIDSIIHTFAKSKISNIKSEMRSFKSNENIHKKEGGSYYVVSANKASSVTL